MIVTIISECEKRARIRSRRILSSYLFQIGRRVWQGHISEEGLTDLRQKLKEVATRQTSIICHRHHGKRPSTIDWVVGSHRHFSEDGLYSYANKSINNYGNRMKNANLEIMHRVVRLSALMHDLGKSTNGFQSKLARVINKDKKSLFSTPDDGAQLADPLRHELISTLLLIPLLEEGKISELKTPEQVRSYFSTTALDNLSLIKESITAALSRCSEDNLNQFVKEFDKIPLQKSGNRLLSQNNWEHCSVTSAIVWLVLCHHRINAAYIPKIEAPKTRKRERKRKSTSEANQTLFGEVSLNRNYVNHHGFKNIDAFFEFTSTPLWNSDSWCARVAETITELEQLNAFDKSIFILNNFNAHSLFYKAKTALIYGDHLGSAHSEICEHQDKGLFTYANTRMDDEGIYRWADSLLAHTLRVTEEATRIFDRLFLRERDEYRQLPVIANQRLPIELKPIGLDESSPFYWQEHVVNNLADMDKQQGFFGIVVSGTGAGKTKGCPMIMSNISQDTRFILALGRKTLTQQAFRDYTGSIIGYNKDDVAMLIGSHVAPKDIDIDMTGNGVMDMSNAEYADFSASEKEFDSPLMELFNEESKEHSMLSSPIGIMTIDHIINLVTQHRSTHCKLMLTAMNSDLIIDELDDFDTKSLVAIGKLIYLFASFGRKVIISSATISPIIAESMMNAYMHGYQIHQQTIGSDKAPNVGFISNKAPYLCVQSGSDTTALIGGYDGFIAKICEELSNEPKRRFAKHLELLNSDGAYAEDEAFRIIDKQAYDFHDSHGISDDDEFKLSFGFVRFNHVKNAQRYSLHLMKSDTHKDIEHKVICYHSRMLNVDRFAVEEFLDVALKRSNASPFNHQLVANAVCEAKKNGKREMMVIVSTTSIQETGRDHDYDWIIAEPLSDRSIIQSAGRVLRHRPTVSPSTPNIAIFTDTIKAYMGKSSAWGFPGIETDRFVNGLSEVLNEPKYPVSFCLSKSTSKQFDSVGITNDIGDETANAINALSKTFIDDKIDATPAISKVTLTSESLIGALETARNFDYLLSSGIENSASLSAYITTPSLLLSTEHADKNKLREKDAGKGKINIDIKLRDYKQGTQKNNWRKFKVPSRRNETWNLNILNYYDDDIDWNRSLITYDLEDKVNEISETHESNKGSIQSYLTSASITIGSKQTELYYSSFLGFIDQKE